MENKVIRTRFAPSPTGYLHVGGLRTALYAYFYAKKNGGQFVLRIEDTDRNRLVEGAVDVIIRTLRETGLIYDEGPDVGGPYGPYIQSERKTGYLEYAKQLVEKGAAYYCFCTKERLETLPDVNGARKYDKHCLHLSKEEVEARLAAGEPYVIRQNVPETEGANTYHDMVFGDITVDNNEMEDQILIKSDGMPTYNFANVIDDHLMNITVVMRGSEYLTSTPKYNMLYDAFGWERPIYIHLPSIMKDAQHKLSKRDGSASYEDLIAKGYLKDAVLNYIALLGWAPKDNREKMTVALEQLPQATDFFEGILAEAGASMKAIAQVNVAVDEIFSNIARYSGATGVVLGCSLKGGRATLRFSDNGRPYDPTEKPDPDTTQSAEEREVGGLGIFMVKKLMDEVTYEYADGSNILTLVKSL